MKDQALIELLYKMADDALILGHRNSEWTGFGPLLEEDIAFSSMAQDKIGHSYALYSILQTLGEAPPDTIAFTRTAEKFHNCILVELPNGEYDFSLIRHFLFDTAEALRYHFLTQSQFSPLAQLAAKITGELRYHTLHANTWIKKLGCATPESISRLQGSLDKLLPYALGIFEPSPYEDELIRAGIFTGEAQLKHHWIQRIEDTLRATDLQLPLWDTYIPIVGGRIGQHSEHLPPLLHEMNEVFQLDPEASW